MSGASSHHHHDHDHDHDDDHDHDHQQGQRRDRRHGREAEHGHHHHHHAPASFGAAFAIGAALNIGFVAVEAGFGVAANSVALLADAGHNLSDVMALLTAWGASVLGRRRPTPRYSYGLGSTSMLAALFNAVSILVVTGGIAWEAIRRLVHPTAAVGTTVMAVAAVGILVNGITAWLFASGRKGDLNIRGVFLHMASDAVISAAVVIVGAAMLATGWLWLDPVASLAVSAVIVLGAWSLMREAVNMVLAAAPAGIEPHEVEHVLADLPGVCEVHDLHIWSMSTTETALTVHLVMQDGHPGDAFLNDLCERLHDEFHIGHATIQVEVDPGVVCPLAAAHVV